MDIHKEVVVATVRGEGESTGVYWKPIYNVFDGFIPHIWIVNARHIKNVPGHKRSAQSFPV